jgi:hypothetical protein
VVRFVVSKQRDLGIGAGVELEEPSRAVPIRSVWPVAAVLASGSHSSCLGRIASTSDHNVLLWPTRMQDAVPGLVALPVWKAGLRSVAWWHGGCLMLSRQTLGSQASGLQVQVCCVWTRDLWVLACSFCPRAR